MQRWPERRPPMQPAFYMLIGFAPGLFWLWFLRFKDDLEPEPLHKVLWVFFLGCASTLPVLGLRPWFDAMLPAGPGWHADTMDAFLVTAVPEEFWKIMAFLLGIFWHRELDEPLDGIIYGAAAGLGFASIETVMYISISDMPSLSLMRGFTSVPMHVATTGSLGFFLGMIRFRPRRQAPLLILTGVLVAVLFHGGYDLFLSRGWTWLALMGLLPLALVSLGIKIRWARARSHRYHPDQVG